MLLFGKVDQRWLSASFGLFWIDFKFNLNRQIFTYVTLWSAGINKMAGTCGS